jgi:hypothetical protein
MMAFMRNRVVLGMRVLAGLSIVALVLVQIEFRGSKEYPNLVPIFDYSDQHNINTNIARALTKVTTEDALLITPPEFGVLRIIGKRALVVDFKSIPFQDLAMKQWYQRITDIYGNVSGGGFKAVEQLDSAYKNISDKKLTRLAQKYGATHAVLYLATKSSLPNVYSNETYQVVKLP